jgi:hypothetical protein
MHPSCRCLGLAASFIQQCRRNCITREQGKACDEVPSDRCPQGGIAARNYSQQAEHSYRVNNRMERRRYDRASHPYQ